MVPQMGSDDHFWALTRRNAASSSNDLSGLLQPDRPIPGYVDLGV
jgi:hypothetical protein